MHYIVARLLYDARVQPLNKYSRPEILIAITELFRSGPFFFLKMRLKFEMLLK